MHGWLDEIAPEKRAELEDELKTARIRYEIRNGRIFIRSARTFHPATGANDIANAYDAINFVNPDSSYWNPTDAN